MVIPENIKELMKFRINIFTLFVAVMVAGCSKADVQTPCEDAVTVNYCIQTPLTKAAGDGSKADYVWYALYRFKDDSFVMECEHIQPFTDGKALCPVRMTLDQSYKVLFVAQHYEIEGAAKTPTYPIDAVNATVSMPAKAVVNSENYDMFAAIDTVMHFKGSAPKSMSLKRIVSMVNFFSSEEDWNGAAQKPAYASLELSSVPKSYSLLTKTASQQTCKVPYAKAPIVSASDRHVATAYCLAGERGIGATINLYSSDQATLICTRTVADIPVAVNKKTQVTGNMIN